MFIHHTPSPQPDRRAGPSLRSPLGATRLLIPVALVAFLAAKNMGTSGSEGGAQVGQAGQPSRPCVLVLSVWVEEGGRGRRCVVAFVMVVVAVLCRTRACLYGMSPWGISVLQSWPDPPDPPTQTQLFNYVPRDQFWSATMGFLSYRLPMLAREVRGSDHGSAPHMHTTSKPSAALRPA
jgi:hypothetical protein